MLDVTRCGHIKSLLQTSIGAINQEKIHTNIDKLPHDILKNLDALMSLSHISINETRYITLNATHFCNNWLARIRVWRNGGWVLECY